MIDDEENNVSCETLQTMEYVYQYLHLACKVQLQINQCPGLQSENLQSYRYFPEDGAACKVDILDTFTFISPMSRLKFRCLTTHRYNSHLASALR